VNKSDTIVVGNICDAPRMNRTQTGSPVTNFRVASTKRRFDQQRQDWVDGHTLYVDIECFGDLAGNVARSLVKGDPVIVTGELYTHHWDSDTGKRESARVKANAVGPDLTRGWATFTRTPRSGAPEPAEAGTGTPVAEPQPVDELDLDPAYELVDDADELLREENPVPALA